MAPRYARAILMLVSSSRIHLVLPLVVALLLAGPATGDTVAMIRVADLRMESLIAKQKGLILVIEFSADDCAYCHKLEE